MKRSFAVVLLILVVAAMATGAPASAAATRLSLTADRTTVTAYPSSENWAVLEVIVTDEGGAPVADVEVSFTVTQNQSGVGGGAVNLTNPRTARPTATTNEDGLAQVIYSAGVLGGTDVVTATAGDLNASIEITVRHSICTVEAACVV